MTKLFHIGKLNIQFAFFHVWKNRYKGEYRVGVIFAVNKMVGNFKSFNKPSDAFKKGNFATVVKIGLELFVCTISVSVDYDGLHFKEVNGVYKTVSR